MLVYDPVRPISAKQCLNHSYFKQFDPQNLPVPAPVVVPVVKESAKWYWMSMCVRVLFVHCYVRYFFVHFPNWYVFLYFSSNLPVSYTHKYFVYMTVDLSVQYLLSLLLNQSHIYLFYIRCADCINRSSFPFFFCHAYVWRENNEPV